MRLLSENTAVSIGLVVTACATIFGVGVFYGSVNAQARAISTLEESQRRSEVAFKELRDKYYTDFTSIKEDIAEMKGIVLGTSKK